MEQTETCGGEKHGKKEEQRKITKERNINTENIFSVLQEKDTEPLQEEEEPPQIFKIDKDEKKVTGYKL